VRRHRLAPLLGLALLVQTAGCAIDDGRAMTPPPPGATTPPPTTGAQAAPAASVPTFTVSSTAFANGGQLPVDVTCEGAGEPPPLTWTAPPPGMAELAVVLTDADDADTALWVVAGLPPQPLTLVAGSLPAGAVDLGYDPPCPPANADTAVYVFTVYALPSPLSIGPDLTPDEALARIGGSPAQAAQITAFLDR
jgi:phosphatidylethanolamine-binding protein (PEBP) family uncharacterized protein